MKEETLRGLIGRIKLSDRSAFKELFDHFQEGIYHFLVYKTGDQNLAEDILQETFLKVWKNREDLNEENSIKSYLYTMANNAALNYYRHQKVVYAHRAHYKVENEDRSPEKVLESEEFRQVLLSTIEKLPEKTRIAFMMSRFEERFPGS